MGSKVNSSLLAEMAESLEDGEDARNDAESGGSDEYEYVTLTSAEVLEKLEEVYTCCMKHGGAGAFWCTCTHDFNT